MEFVAKNLAAAGIYRSVATSTCIVGNPLGRPTCDFVIGLAMRSHEPQEEIWDLGKLGRKRDGRQISDGLVVVVRASNVLLEGTKCSLNISHGLGGGVGDMASLVAAIAATALATTTLWFPLWSFSLVIADGVSSDRASLILLLAFNHGHNKSLSISSCGFTRRRYYFLFYLVVLGSDSFAIGRQSN